MGDDKYSDLSIEITKPSPL